MKVLFVGGFKKPQGGVMGGQVFASNSLLNSPLSEVITWIKVNTALDRLPLPSIQFRIYKSIIRILYYSLKITMGVDVALIFSASGLSMLEKGVMSIIARVFMVPVVFAPRGSEIGRVVGWKRKLYSFLLRRSTLIICQSEQWKKFYIELTGFNENKVAVVYNWIHLDEYVNMKIPRERKTVTVLYMGWMVATKGIFDLVKVVEMDRTFFTSTRFVLCGGGEDLEKFRIMVDKLGMSNLFEVTGWVEGEQKKSYLESADIFVLPSYGEGMPNALLEAMACGKACIATTVGGIPDMISNGENGLLYDAGNINAFQTCLKKMINNREARVVMGEKARERAKSVHDINIVWPQMLRYFQMVRKDSTI